MTWKCDLIEPFSKQKGNMVSHSNRKKIKHFKTNLQEMVFFSETLQKKFSLKVAVKTNRIIVKCGGFDEFLLSRPGCPPGSNMARSNILTALGLKLRRMIKKKKLENTEVSNQN